MRYLELDKKHSISGCAAFAARVKRGRKWKQVLRRCLGSLWNEELYATAFHPFLVSRTADALSGDGVSGGTLRAVARAVKRPPAVLSGNLAAHMGSTGEHFMGESLDCEKHAA